MYHPYLRGKQYELILLRENAHLLADSNTHPIIEPVKQDFKALVKALEVMEKKQVKSTLIINPQVGETPVSTQSIIDALINDKLQDFHTVSLGYIINANSSIHELKYFLSNFQNWNFDLIHYGFSDGLKIAESIENFSNISSNIFIDGYTGKLYQKHLNREGIDRILIRDGFKPKKKNSLYPLHEHFSDLHETYELEGMNGFGDFLIVGDDYSETGGPAYAVAIHLTFISSDKDMYIYHFVSDQTDSPTNPGGKFLEALNKLVSAIRQPESNIYHSQACNLFLDLYNKEHYPGLGYVKKLSMQHHIELIADFLSKEK